MAASSTIHSSSCVRHSCTSFGASVPLVRYMLIQRDTGGKGGGVEGDTQGALYREYLHGKSPPAIVGLLHFILCVPVFFWSSVVELNLGTMP